MLKKIFNYYGYTFSKIKKSNLISDIIKLRLRDNNCDVLIDVGANKGDFSYDFLKNFKKIFLIEPNPNLKDQLEDRFKNNTNIKIFNFGINNKNSIKKLYISDDTGSTLSSIKKQNKILQKNLKKTNIVSVENINFYRLDKLLKKNIALNETIFLKTDTQGNDLEVLKSLGIYLKKVKYIKSEMSIIPLYRSQDSHWKIVEFMKKNNFEPIFFENGLRDNIGKMIEYDIFFERKN
jgi:FkbM family methyltransferase